MSGSVELRIEAQNFDEIEKFFQSASDRVKDWTGVGESIATIVRDDVRLRFQSSPAVEVGGMVWGDVYWRPLNEGYLMSRPDRRSGQILIDTEALKRSLTENTPESFTEITESEIRVGTTIPYAESLKDEFPFLFWHPILLERVTKHLMNWYLTGQTIEAEYQQGMNQ